VAPGAGWVIGAIAVAGLADGPQLSAVFAVRHRETPARLRAQVFTTAASLKIAAGSLGAALAGHLPSPGLALTVAAATQAAALVAYLTIGRRQGPQTGEKTAGHKRGGEIPSLS